jgi:hypothetical protein
MLLKETRPLRSRRQNTSRALVLALVCAFCGGISAAPRPDDFIGRAMQLWRSRYPELKDVCTTIIDHFYLNGRPPNGLDVINNFDMNLFPCRLPPWDPRYRVGGADPVLTSIFTFDTQNKVLIRFWAFGPLVRGRLDEFEREVGKHPEWSDAEIAQALKKAGAKFGPDDRTELLRTLPLKDLEAVTGPGRLEAVSASLGVQYRFPVLEWRVLVKWRSDDGRSEADYLLWVEPFDGRLVRFELHSEIRPVQ